MTAKKRPAKKAVKNSRKSAPPKRGRGRPTKFKAEYVLQAEKLCLLGATDREVAEFFGVNEATVHRWKLEHEDFCEALKVGKQAADERVKSSLYRRALGYTHDAVKIMQHDGAPVIVPYVEHVPPDTTAAIFWLKNRCKEEFRDKIDLNHSGEVSVTRKVYSAGAAGEDERGN